MSNRMNKTFYIVFAIFCLLFTITASAVTINARVDRNPIAVDQTFRLILTVNNPSSSMGLPDLQPLEKDFTILGTNQSNQMSIINGKTHSRYQWIIVLAPKVHGQLTIPAIHMGKTKSQPIPITVTAETQVKTPGQIHNAFLTAKVSTHHPYVQGEVLYTIKIYYRANIAHAKLITATLKNAMIKSIRQDQSYTTVIKGQQYHVLEKRYLIYPQRRGKLIITAPILRGQFLNSDLPSLVQQYLNNQGQAFQVTGPAITLNVKPIPANYPAQWWLPAKTVKLTENWSAGLKHIRVGEPITRTLTLSAAGLTAASLPPIPLVKTDDFNIYPDHPKLSDQLQGGNVVGKRIEKIVYIPKHSGSIKLPSIRIPWWNTKLNKAETAVIPARTISISSTPEAINKKQNNAPIAKTTAPTPQPSAPAMPSKITKPHFTIWLWVVLTSLVIGLLVVGLLALLVWKWPWQRKSGTLANDMKGSQPQQTKQKALLKQHLATIKAASLANDAKKTEAAILTWANTQWPEQRLLNLNDVAKQFPSLAEMKTALQELYKILYSGKAQQWQGQAFWQLFEKHSQQQTTKIKKKNDDLPELYLT